MGRTPSKSSRGTCSACWRNCETMLMGRRQKSREVEHVTTSR